MKGEFLPAAFALLAYELNRRSLLYPPFDQMESRRVGRNQCGKRGQGCVSVVTGKQAVCDMPSMVSRSKHGEVHEKP